LLTGWIEARTKQNLKNPIFRRQKAIKENNQYLDSRGYNGKRINNRGNYPVDDGRVPFALLCAGGDAIKWDGRREAGGSTTEREEGN